MLSCPRCRTPLTAHTITTDAQEWEVEVDVCEHGCGGIWLDAHDFEADPEAKLLLDQELKALNVPAKKAVNTKAPGDCPKCAVAMHRFNWNNEGISLDSCPMCQGRWIDGGEVRAIHDEWGKEPLDARQERELLKKVAEVKDETLANWQEGESFWEWCMKRVLLTNVRGRR